MTYLLKKRALSRACQHEFVTGSYFEYGSVGAVFQVLNRVFFEWSMLILTI
jgi:hypothetical protein